MNEQVLQKMLTEGTGAGPLSGPGIGAGLAAASRGFPQAVNSRHFAISTDESYRTNRE